MNLQDSFGCLNILDTVKCKITPNLDSILILEEGRIDNEGEINVDVI